MHHYTYQLARITGLQTGPRLYIGVRSSKCDPALDDYMSSSNLVKSAMLDGHQFEKEVLATFETRAEAEADEIRRLRAANAPKNSDYYNVQIGSEKFSTHGTRKFRDPKTGDTYLLLPKKGEALGLERVWPTHVFDPSEVAHAPKNPIAVPRNSIFGQLVAEMPNGLSRNKIMAISNKFTRHDIVDDDEFLANLDSSTVGNAKSEFGMVLSLIDITLCKSFGYFVRVERRDDDYLAFSNGIVWDDRDASELQADLDRLKVEHDDFMWHRLSLPPEEANARFGEEKAMYERIMVLEDAIRQMTGATFEDQYTEKDV